jgi:hypothetical protein
MSRRKKSTRIPAWYADLLNKKAMEIAQHAARYHPNKAWIAPTADGVMSGGPIPEDLRRKIADLAGRKPKPDPDDPCKAIARLVRDHHLGRATVSDKEFMSKWAYEQFCRPKDQGSWDDILERARMNHPQFGWPKNIRTLRKWAIEYRRTNSKPEIPSRNR